MSCGGSMKKYQSGGTKKTVIGPPAKPATPIDKYKKEPSKVKQLINKYKGDKGSSVDPTGAIKKALADGPQKMKKGGFPDLTGDGKVTRADILKGRGVIKKSGGAINKKK